MAKRKSLRKILLSHQRGVVATVHLVHKGLQRHSAVLVASTCRRLHSARSFFTFEYPRCDRRR